MAQIVVEVKKKGFEKDGKTVEYFELSANFAGEMVKIRLAKGENELLMYFLGKMNIPLETDEKAELTKRLLAGEKLSAEEKAKLKALIGGEEGGD